MNIQSVSFWQQDRNFWARGQARDASLASTAALITVMGSAMTNLATGLASIANQTALNRVNTELSAAVQSALNGVTGNTSSSSTASSSTAASAPPAPTPAVGTGTVPLTTGTSLLTLGIVKTGTISISDGKNTTKYTSTGTDTVGDLINAINTQASAYARVAAGLNDKGQLVLSGQNTSDTITITGIFAANLGFGTGNNSFSPTVPPAPPASNAASPSSSSSRGSTGGSKPSSGLLNSATALQTGGTAEILLASSGLAGSLVNLLA